MQLTVAASAAQAQIAAGAVKGVAVVGLLAAVEVADKAVDRGNGLGNAPGASSEGSHLEHAHRTVPEHRAGGQVLQQRHGVALRQVGQPILAKAA